MVQVLQSNHIDVKNNVNEWEVENIEVSFKYFISKMGTKIFYF